MVRAGVPWSGAWRYGRSGCAGGEAPAGTGVDEPGEAGPSSRPPQVRVTQLWRKNMTVWRFTSRWLSALVFSAIAVCAFAQAPDAEFKPEVGQSGKDVDWVPDETAELGCDSYCTAYLWIVPARVEGRWRTPQGELTLKQDFQKISGALKSGNVAAPIARGSLRGDQISFLAAGAEYRGRVNGNTIEGTVKTAGKSEGWKATR